MLKPRKPIQIVLLALLAVAFIGCARNAKPDDIVDIMPPTPTQTQAIAPTVEPMPITANPTEFSTAEPTVTPTAKPPAGPLAGKIIGLDPGHQAKSNHDTEPEAPGSDKMKAKVSSGTRGVATGIYEYEVNLKVASLLKVLLEAQGATVIMTRESHDVDISNAERAKMFNKAKTDYALRLHCDGTTDNQKRGAFMLVPKTNPYLYECNLAAELLIDEYCAYTGLKNRGITVRDDQTGFNWCERMIINIEMGYMSNADEDRLLTDAAFQQKMAEGLLRGILRYFG